MLKQLRYFTPDERVVTRMLRSLQKDGIDLRFKIFPKDNQQHQFDGLLMASEQAQQLHIHRYGTVLFVALAFIASVAISIGVLSFYEIALASFGVFALVTLLETLFQSKTAEDRDSNNTVFFVVIDVENASAEKVSHALASEVHLYPH